VLTFSLLGKDYAVRVTVLITVYVADVTLVYYPVITVRPTDSR